MAALGEAMLEFNQTHSGQPQYLQGFSGDTSNVVIAAIEAQGFVAVAPLPRPEQVRALL